MCKLYLDIKSNNYPRSDWMRFKKFYQLNQLIPEIKMIIVGYRWNTSDWGHSNLANQGGKRRCYIPRFILQFINILNVINHQIFFMFLHFKILFILLIGFGRLLYPQRVLYNSIYVSSSFGWEFVQGRYHL